MMKLFAMISIIFFSNWNTIFGSRASQTDRIYVGCYSEPDGIGTGIIILQKAGHNYEYHDNVSCISPSVLAMDHEQHRLYAVNEMHRFNIEKGFVVSYNLDQRMYTNGIHLMNNRSSLGVQPNFITLDPSGKFLLVTNFGSAGIVIFRLKSDGQLGDVTQNLINFGKNPHHFNFDRKHNVVAVPFLGSDVVYFFSFDYNRGMLVPYNVKLNGNTTTHLKAVVKPSSGPRHLVYSANFDRFYVISEKISVVSVFKTEINRDTGQYVRLQTVSLLPKSYNGKNWGAEIAIHPNGKYLYASERGINHIAIFKIEESNGKLKLMKFHPCGKTPRHFVIRSLKKRFYQMFVANEGNHSIDVFSIKDSGGLDLDYTIRGINSPTFLQFSSNN